MSGLRVDVVYALAEAQDIVSVELAEGAICWEAIQSSGLLVRHELKESTIAIGIAGTRVARDHRLQDGDRLEILRPLAADPNEARRARAQRRRRVPRRT